MQRKAEFYEQFRNQRQGRIQIHDVLRTEKRVGKIWACTCDCGREFEASTSKLAFFRIIECPECARKHRTEEEAQRLWKHGYGTKKNRFFREWCAMNRRCYCPSDTGYPFYGARGIEVCEEWRHDFKAFHDWAVANGYTNELTLDRIDPDGNYEPANCRWVSMAVQKVNRRNARFISVNGVTMCLTHWCRAIGISHTGLVSKSDAQIEDYIRGHFPAEFIGQEYEMQGRTVFVWEG